ncbi:MAG: sulfite exporter TauE/SafE family protein [Actinobacteria bacterium]|nr:sulfite exporter TauE/SafE family protein [Actinomycetota bacterium]
MIALTVFVGVLAGILSAMLGVGGAVVTTPAVRLLGATPIEAVGSTVPATMPGAIAGALRYTREGLVDWRCALGLGISGAALSLVGALTSTVIDGGLLMVLTAGLMLWSGVTVVRGIEPQGADPESSDAAERSVARGTTLAGITPPLTEADASLATSTALPSRPLLPIIGLGMLSGFIAGLLGIGGGILMVPVLTGPLRTPVKSAVASSLVAVAIFSVPALIAHGLLGHIDWWFAVPLMAGVVPGARIGARITIGASDRTVRLLFGTLIVAVAIVYGATEALALF